MEELSGFYKLSAEERLKKIKKIANLTDDEAQIISDTGALKLELADRMVENVIGAIHLPLGIATNFVINGKEFLIPMALEEPSVIAAACKAAKQTLPQGFKADADSPVMIGQIQVVDIPDIGRAKKELEQKRSEIMKLAEKCLEPHAKWGIKPLGFNVRELSDMLLVEFDVNVSDAMGANMVNSTLEGVAPAIEEYTGGKVRLRILTNLAVKRKARATAVWKKEVVGEDVIAGVLDGYKLAKSDIYRCATHNKGIMNGIDAVMLATGNDWRAVEAGAHAFAAMNGYKPLTHYEKNKNGDLVGTIEMPLVSATVGGAVNTSPTAKITLKISGVKSSAELAMAAVCVGLANNFAALAALSTVGIQKGHMKLHAKNIAVLVGAKTPEEIDAVANELDKLNDFSSENAKKILDRLRVA
ncbi:hydroxymethylglutaryl-CoA reductase, degradative [Candidatus Micrarchaeota archaeon]|nr:hydroxymethylglutaryl-CoA reductase, degradative [Candidatus Micrarchaeota archaeon]MBU1165301.1 hydroxymethylglutaryl-CoA reductase, degradative [Candidatus Micrarchaeota archaeon]MBU1886143.1 hydroxymethylglutaryl-CoA reductase, degradative [Candidatus Micrarchaeota archaeon]